MAVALYARVSTSKQAEKDLSIPDQLRQMREWCKRQGYGVGVEYIEPGASATDDRRPVFQQMIADARQYVYQSPWNLLFPILAIFLTVTAFNLLGDGLRRTLDVRLTESGR